jgi:hypothetical protein
MAGIGTWANAGVERVARWISALVGRVQDLVVGKRDRDADQTDPGAKTEVYDGQDREKVGS